MTQATETKWSTLVICTDAGSCEYTPEDGTLAECLADFFESPQRNSVEAAERYLEKCGGYGWIEVDGKRVMEVRS